MPIHSIKSLTFSPGEANRGAQALRHVLTDKFAYGAQERVIHGYASLEPPEVPGPPPTGYTAHLAVLNAAGQTLHTAVEPVSTTRLSFLVDTQGLPVGFYTLTARLSAGAITRGSATKTWPFKISEAIQPTNPFPKDGLPLQLTSNQAGPGRFPVTAAVPLPFGVPAEFISTLGVSEDGQQIPCDVEVVGTWDAAGAPQWLHVRFLANFVSTPLPQYRLVSGTPLRGALKVDTQTQAFAIDTGRVMFVVSRLLFDGINRLWHDPTGKGHYDFARPLVVRDGAAGGLLLRDGLQLEYRGDKDPLCKVVLERQTDFSATIRAEGVYQCGNNLATWMRYVVRITAFSGSDVVLLDHVSILCDDSRKRAIADLAWVIPARGVQVVHTGVNGKTRTTTLTQQAPVFYHQVMPDLVQQVTPITPKLASLATLGTRLDGWGTIETANGALTLLTRHAREKYPKELELGPTGLSYHIWPLHGQPRTNLAEDTSPQNLHKLRCLHSGRELRFPLPDAYAEAIRISNDTTECRPEWSTEANEQGIAIRAELALVCSGVLEAPNWQKLYEQRPAAYPSSAWLAQSEVFGRQAPVEGAYTSLEETFVRAMVGFGYGSERLEILGQFLYGDLPHVTLPAEMRPDLHRVRGALYHYQGLSSLWRMVIRHGNQELLDMARRCTDLYASIWQTKWDGMRGYQLANGTLSGGRADFGNHLPGGFFHCKALKPTGGEAYGMVHRDGHQGLHGHWTEPTGLLLAWYLDADLWAKESYELYLEGVRKYQAFPIRGTGREVNGPLVFAIEAYNHTHDATLLPYIHGMGAALRAIPLATQQVQANQGGPAGPLFHPEWPVRYYEQTRDPAYASFIIEAAKLRSYEQSLSYALSAAAYELTGDKQLLERHLPSLVAFEKNLFRRPGTYWDGYGAQVGIGDGGLFKTWPRLKAALLEAPDLVLPEFFGYHPHSYSNPGVGIDYSRQSEYVVHVTSAGPWPLTIDAVATAGNDSHKVSIQVLDPDGKQVFTVPQLGGPNNFKQVFDIPAGKIGLYKIWIGGHELSIRQPMTPWPMGLVLRNSQTYAAASTRGHLRPLVPMATFCLKVEQVSTRGYMTFRWYDSSWHTKSVLAGEKLTDDPQPMVSKFARLEFDAASSEWELEFTGSSSFFRMTPEMVPSRTAPIVCLYGHDRQALNRLAEQLAQPVRPNVR